VRRAGFRLTTLRLMIGVAALACPLFLIGQESRRHREGHRERCLHIADIHASLGIEYRRNADGDPVRLRIAAWHEQMHRVFVEAASHPEGRIPATRPAPPEGWEPTGEPR
jgi:hypothetical protein